MQPRHFQKLLLKFSNFRMFFDDSKKLFFKSLPNSYRKGIHPVITDFRKPLDIRHLPNFWEHQKMVLNVVKYHNSSRIMMAVYGIIGYGSLY